MATWNQVFEIRVVSADAGCLIAVRTLFLRKHFLYPNQHAAGLSLLMVFFAGMSLSIKKKKTIMQPTCPRPEFTKCVSHSITLLLTRVSFKTFKIILVQYFTLQNRTRQ